MSPPLFFVTGGWVDAYPEDIKAIQAAGHDLGNHSATHSDMNGLDAKKQTEELLTVHQKVKELTGADMTLFRPPFGDYNDLVIQTARENGYFTILWDIDSMDWKDYGTDSIIDAVYNHRRLGNGSIILCHNGAKYTAEALDPLIKLLKEKRVRVCSCFQADLSGELSYGSGLQTDSGLKYQKTVLQSTALTDRSFGADFYTT